MSAPGLACSVFDSKTRLNQKETSILLTMLSKHEESLKKQHIPVLANSFPAWFYTTSQVGHRHACLESFSLRDC